MLPMEVVVPSKRVSKHNCLNPQEYSEAMMMELEALDVSNSALGLLYGHGILTIY